MCENNDLSKLRSLGFNVDVPQCQYCELLLSKSADKDDPKCPSCCAKGRDEKTLQTWLEVGCFNCSKSFYTAPNKVGGETFECPYCECEHEAVEDKDCDSNLHWYPKPTENAPTTFEEDHNACFNCVNDVTCEKLVCTCWRIRKPVGFLQNES